ncbi:hypothetical protein F4859DRAFT_120021 [Xylaria cf. heliscus]|nr:hypothetical protein F4859DRAFT_120021 [Xylaria cf. heliscus]
MATLLIMFSIRYVFDCWRAGNGLTSSIHLASLYIVCNVSKYICCYLLLIKLAAACISLHARFSPSLSFYSPVPSDTPTSNYLFIVSHASHLFVMQIVHLLSQGYIRHYSNNLSERH